MNRMIAITIRPGATTAAVRLIVSGNACPIIPPPAATSTRKNVPSNSENKRRHSCEGSWKSSTAETNLCSTASTGVTISATSHSSLVYRHRTDVPQSTSYARATNP